MNALRHPAVFGTTFAVLYTLMISSADAITKFIAGGFAAPQLFAVSGTVVALMSWGGSRLRGETGGLRTSCPRAMALRSGLTVVGSVAFFYAFKQLAFAEVFVFIGLIPIFAGLLSGPVLGEGVRPVAWVALCAGFAGVLFLFPQGVASISLGHLIALSATVCGALSMVLARYIGKHEQNALAQVFYPNLSLAIVMTLVLPFVFKPMGATDLAWILAYAGFLFVARWLLVVSLRLMAAYVVTPLMNLQFVWMVVLGALFFGEVPASNIYLGVAIIIGSGGVLIYDQLQPANAAYPWLMRLRAWMKPPIVTPKSVHQKV